MSKACIDRSDSLIFQHKRRPRVIGFTYASSEVPFRSTESQTFYRSMMTADQMSVRELRHDKPSRWFSKSRGLSASVSFHFSPPPTRSFTCAIFRTVLTLVPRSLLLNRTKTLATQAKGYLKRSCGNRKKTPREQEEGKPHGANCRQLAGYLSTCLARRLLARS